MSRLARKRAFPQEPAPPEEFLAIARALAIRHAREDHAAEQARLERRVLQPDPDR
jgi:hypothetical protein